MITNNYELKYQKISFFQLKSLFVFNRILAVVGIIALFQPLKGQTLQDIENVRKQYQEALKRQELQKPQEVRDAEETAKSTSLPDKVIYTRKEVESLIVNTQKLLDKLNSLQDSSKSFGFIGYDIFSTRDSIPFWQNLPTPNDYILGPGDEIIISLHGSIELSITETINRDGQVFLKDVGTINLSGMSIDKAYKYIKNKYSKAYSTLLGDRPTTFFDITLGELKSINVHVVGFAVYPGIHIVHPFSSVFSALSQSGGVDLNGSLREIKIIRDGEIISSVDLYDYLFLGKSLSDIRLLDQDIILIPPRKSTIAINGRIKNPGYYEAKQSESIQNLIDYSGGYSTLAQDYIFIVNNDYKNRRSAIIKSEDLYNNKIFNGDSIHIPIINPFQEYITLDGSIKSPGKYPYQEGMSLKELLLIDGSIEDKVFMNSIDLKNISIYRRKQNSIDIDRLVIDLTDNKNDIILQNFDQISVPPNQLYKPLHSIIITGEVLFPGLYNINNQKTLNDIINSSGGLTKDALKNGIEIYRDSLRVAWENMDFILDDGDSLNVLRKTGTVQVIGEVHKPGFITYKKSYNVKNYINLAGGFNSYANNKDIMVIEPNGRAIPRKRIGWQSVPEGAMIVVHKKSLLSSANRVGGWESFGLVTTQLSNVATTILTLMVLINQSSSSNGG